MRWKNNKSDVQNDSLIRTCILRMLQKMIIRRTKRDDRDEGFDMVEVGDRKIRQVLHLACLAGLVHSPASRKLRVDIWRDPRSPKILK